MHVDGDGGALLRTPIVAGHGQKVVTLEGLGTPRPPHPVQRAFIDEQAVQCGYCINGMIMQSAAFLARNPKPTEAQVKEALANNICRCGTHPRVVAAVLRAAAAEGGRPMNEMIARRALLQAGGAMWWPSPDSAGAEA